MTVVFNDVSDVADEAVGRKCVSDVTTGEGVGIKGVSDVTTGEVVGIKGVIDVAKRETVGLICVYVVVTLDVAKFGDDGLFNTKTDDVARCCETTVGVVGGEGGTGNFSDGAADVEGNCLSLTNADVVGCVVIGVLLVLNVDESGWGTLCVVYVGATIVDVIGELVRNEEKSRQFASVCGRRLKHPKPVWSTTGR